MKKKDKNRTLLLVFSIFIIGIIIFIGYYLIKQNNQKDNSLEKVKVQAGWLLNGEFANICSAIVNGEYEKEGLDVEMIPGGPTGASFTLATNSVAQNPDITLGVEGDLVPLLRGRTKQNESEQLKVKAFASFWNENPFGFIVKKDSGLDSLKDFANKKPNGEKYKIGVTADSVIQYAIAKYIGIDVDNLNIVIVGFDATPFLTGQVDALAGYWTTQAYEVEKAGIDYKFLSASELPGFNQPSMIAIATEDTLKNKKQTLVKWLRATQRGSKFVIENPEIAAKHILDKRCGGPNFNETQELWLIKKSLPLFDKQSLGSLSKSQVMGFAKAYFNLGQIPRLPKSEELIDFSILNSL